MLGNNGDFFFFTNYTDSTVSMTLPSQSPRCQWHPWVKLLGTKVTLKSDYAAFFPLLNLTPRCYWHRRVFYDTLEWEHLCFIWHSGVRAPMFYTTLWSESTYVLYDTLEWEHLCFIWHSGVRSPMFYMYYTLEWEHPCFIWHSGGRAPMFYFSRDNQTKKDLVNLLYLKINKALNKLCYLRLNLIYEYLHDNLAIFEHV